MSASTKAKEIGLKSLVTVMKMTEAPRSTLEDWEKTRPALFNIILFGCKKAHDAIPEGWTYDYIIDNPTGRHCFVNDSYNPDSEDLDAGNIVVARTFIEGLNEIKERTTLALGELE